MVNCIMLQKAFLSFVYFYSSKSPEKMYSTELKMFLEQQIRICNPGAQVLSCWSIFVVIARNTLYASKLLIFYAQNH